MKNYFGESIVVPIYISVDDGVRLERALTREKLQKDPNYLEMCRRFLADEEDFSEEKLRECHIERIYRNEDLNGCIEEIKKSCFSHI